MWDRFEYSGPPNDVLECLEERYPDEMGSFYQKHNCNAGKTLNMRCFLVRSCMITDSKMLMQDVRSQMKVNDFFLEGLITIFVRH